MFLSFPVHPIIRETRLNLCILVLVAIFASVSGTICTLSADHIYVLMMRMAAGCRVSIVGAVITVLPFLVSFYILVHSKPWLVFLICGIDLFLLSAALMSIRISYGSAGWLISLLLLFSDLILTPLVIYLSVIRLRSNSISLPPYVPFVVCGIVGMIDYTLISPFLAELINSYETMGRYAIHVGLDRCL